MIKILEGMLKPTTIGLAVILLIVLTGCKTPKDASMFRDVVSEQSVYESVAATPIKVMPGDKLYIIVSGRDAQLSSMFNLPVYTTRVDESGVSNGAIKGVDNVQGVNASSQGLASYTVSAQGDIEFPVLGKIKVEGMTRQEVSALIKGELLGRDLIKDPTVSVEFANNGINVLGLVKTPGRYQLNTDKITLLEILAMAGGIRDEGRNDMVKVLRKDGDKIKSYIVDMTSLEKTATSPVYYLQQDDVVYVEPNDMQKRSTTVNGNSAYNTSFWISAASLLTTVVTTIGVFVK